MGILDLGVAPVASLIQDVVDKIFPDKVAQAKDREAFLLQVQQLDNAISNSQIEVNKIEASNQNVFVAGWRPFIGWVCGTAFAYHEIAQPLASYIMAARGINIVLPAFNDTLLSQTLFGLLGINVAHTGIDVVHTLIKNKK